MGSVHDEVTLEQFNLIRLAIDEINMLEELLYSSHILSRASGVSYGARGVKIVST